jgi:hypothetical protein
MFGRLLAILVSVMAAAGAGYGACRLAGRDAFAQAALAAAIICSLSAMLAALPALLSRQADVAAASQAGLIGTLGHLLLTLLLAAAAWALKLVHQRQPFLLWLIVLYWVSLVALVCVVLQVIRHAQPVSK